MRKVPMWTVGLLLALTAPASAQSADFLFRKPAVTFGIRGGWAAPRAQSEIFEFTMEQLVTRGGLEDLERSDFAGPALAFDVGAYAGQRLDIVLGVAVTGSSVRTESRGFVGTDDLPIEQTTDFLRVPVTLGAKVYLKDRGRPVSRFAWVPYHWAPWVGAGAGGMYSEFEQTGEFVDYQTLDIFGKQYDTDGFTPTAYAAAGVDYSLGAHWLVTGEARYNWAKAGMDESFVGFDDIDLSGLQMTAGISVRF
jgi:hypothetical protein